MTTLQEIIQKLKPPLLHAVLSSPASPEFPKKTVIRPVDGYLQITEFQGAKALHRNIPLEALASELELLIPRYRQGMFYTEEADWQLLGGRKWTLLKKPPSKTRKNETHNREKNYLLAEHPFLVELGIQNAEGKVFAKKQDKFRQVNRFLEIVADTLDALPQEGPIRVVDFGCGKASLTFGLYVLLDQRFGERVQIHGVDMRPDVIAFCEEKAKKLGFDRLTFSTEAITSYKKPADMVVALHACDTATDDALAYAIRAKAAVILAVPCCHHELASQVQHDQLQPILKHGILKERFATLVTDALRAEILQEEGYSTQVLEFIDLEHTAKNLLIRALRGGTKTGNSSAFQEALHLSSALRRSLDAEKTFFNPSA